jgi:hypothetical protein
MKSNNSTGGFTKIATVAMQALSPVSSFDGGGRNITKLSNSLDFSDILKSGILGAGIGCATGPNSGDFAHPDTKQCPPDAHSFSKSIKPIKPFPFGTGA